jgi:hypothetical protein
LEDVVCIICVVLLVAVTPATIAVVLVVDLGLLTDVAAQRWETVSGSGV